MLEAFGLSDPGCIRTNNEDYFMLVAPLDLYLVADGMGGAQAGEHASKLAVETVVDFIVKAGGTVTNQPSRASRLRGLVALVVSGGDALKGPGGREFPGFPPSRYGSWRNDRTCDRYKILANLLDQKAERFPSPVLSVKSAAESSVQSVAYEGRNLIAPSPVRTRIVLPPVPR